MKAQDQQDLQYQAISFLEKLPLFQTELDLVNQIIGTNYQAIDERVFEISRTRSVMESTGAEKQPQSAIQEKIEQTNIEALVRKKKVFLEQKFSNLKEKIRDIKGSVEDILQNRTALKSKKKEN